MRSTPLLGTIIGMNPRRLRLLLPATAGALVLSACGTDAQDTVQAGASSVGSAAASVSSAAGSDGSSSSSSSSSASSSAAPADPGGSTAAADIDFDDQDGAGDVAVIARVTAPQGGFVVVTVDDDDRDNDGALLGATPVEAGTTRDVQVALAPPLERDTDLRATLYADTDGDGAFDPAVDQRVPEPDDDDDDDNDWVDDEADYDVR